jgi:hypothetical protein
VNGLGVYDGAANIVSQLGVWGIPYFVGRVYFKDLEGFKELGLGIVIGAILYLPMCYVEMVISPTLHQKLYGRVQHSLAMSKRWGGYRPMVFMQSGLALAMYMTFATLVAGWMWMSGTVRNLFGVPMLAVVGVLFFTQIVVCKTMAATGFMFVGIAALLWIRTDAEHARADRRAAGARARRGPADLHVPAVQRAARRGGGVGGGRTIASEDRLQSLGVRLKAEDLVVAKAFDAPNPWWGWGKWDPNQPGITPWRVYTESMKIAPDGLEYRQLKDTAVTDGLWIIVIGQYGIVGLVLLTTAITAPALILWGRVPVRYWGHRAVAPVAAMAILLVLHMVDNLLNGMINALFMLALGGVSAIGPAVRQVHRRFGPLAVHAVLDQQVGGGPAGPPHGAAPTQAYGQFAARQARPGAQAAGGYGQAFPAYGAYPATPPSAYPAVPGFPSIAGLQAGRPRSHKAKPVAAGDDKREEG